MARETLDRIIRHLLDQILLLDGLVENATIESMEALKAHDVVKAREIYAADRLINARRFELENEVIVTIATQQPIMAGDLRLMASILEVVGELERMGDYAKGIAKICIQIGSEPHVKPLIDLPKMSEIVVEMLHNAVTAFVKLDVEAAQRIPSEDERIDQLYNMIYEELITIIMRNPATAHQANHLMWAAHNLERMADRVTNICERTIYCATGKLIEIDFPQDL